MIDPEKEDKDDPEQREYPCVRKPFLAPGRQAQAEPLKCRFLLDFQVRNFLDFPSGSPPLRDRFSQPRVPVIRYVVPSIRRAISGPQLSLEVRARSLRKNPALPG